MKILLSISFFLLCLADLQAQFTKTVSLKPIQIQGEVVFGMKYRYGLRMLNDAYALEVPLSSLENKEVERQYQGFKRLDDAARWVNLVPLFYFVYQVSNTANSGRRFVNANSFWAVWGGSLLAAWGIKIAGRVKLKRAIDTYNDVIFMPEVGQVNHIIDTPNNSINYGLKAVYRF